MQKRIGLVSLVALVFVVYLIWENPTGMADIVSGFGSAVGGFFSELWDRLWQFVSSLAGEG